jgi:integrase/recombinase XerD
MKVYLEPEEVVNMEKAAGNLRDRILIHILFRLGCRVSEALGLTVEDVDLAKDTVTIKHLKSRLKLSCITCGQRLGRRHTFCHRCGAKIEKAQIEQQEHHRQRVLPIDKDTVGTCPAPPIISSRRLRIHNVKPR